MGTGEVRAEAGTGEGIKHSKIEVCYHLFFPSVVIISSAAANESVEANANATHKPMSCQLLR